VTDRYQLLYEALRVVLDDDLAADLADMLQEDSDIVMSVLYDHWGRRMVAKGRVP
jgi:hypothetical protein